MGTRLMVSNAHKSAGAHAPISAGALWDQVISVRLLRKTVVQRKRVFSESLGPVVSQRSHIRTS